MEPTNPMTLPVLNSEPHQMKEKNQNTKRNQEAKEDFYQWMNKWTAFVDASKETIQLSMCRKQWSKHLKGSFQQGVAHKPNHQNEPLGIKPTDRLITTIRHDTRCLEDTKHPASQRIPIFEPKTFANYPHTFMNWVSSKQQPIHCLLLKEWIMNTQPWHIWGLI